MFPATAALPVFPFCSASCGIFPLVPGLATVAADPLPALLYAKSQGNSHQPKQNCLQHLWEHQLPPAAPLGFSHFSSEGGRTQDASRGKREEKGWRKQFLDQSPAAGAEGGRQRGLTSLTTVELLGSQGDDGAAVQVPRSLAGGSCLDAALLRVFLQQLCQPQQVTVAEQGVGVQPPATARKRQLSAQPPIAALPPSPGHRRGAVLWSEGSLGWFALHLIISQVLKFEISHWQDG